MQPEKVRPTGKISPGNHAARQSRAHDVASIKPLAAFDVHHHEIAASSVNPSVHAEQQHIDSEMVLRWAKRNLWFYGDAYEKRVQAYKRDQHVHARDTWNLDPQIIANLNNADDRWNLDPETHDTCANSSTAPVAPLARADSPPPSSPRGSPEFKYIKPQHHDVQARDTWNLDPQIIANLNNADRWNLDPETYDTANSSTAPVAPLAHVDSQPPSSPRGSPEFKYIKRVAGQWVQDKRETLDSTAEVCDTFNTFIQPLDMRTTSTTAPGGPSAPSGSHAPSTTSEAKASSSSSSSDPRATGHGSWYVWVHAIRK